MSIYVQDPEDHTFGTSSAEGAESVDVVLLTKNSVKLASENAWSQFIAVSAKLPHMIQSKEST